MFIFAFTKALSQSTVPENARSNSTTGVFSTNGLDPLFGCQHELQYPAFGIVFRMPILSHSKRICAYENIRICNIRQMASIR